MKYRTIEKLGWNLSEIGFGAWAIGGGWGSQDDNDSVKALHRALDLGVNFIDTAAGYGGGHSEKIIGKVLSERSDPVYVATKTPPQGPGPWPPSPYCRAEVRYEERYLRENIEERLRNLKTDCIDLLQLHTWTRAWNRDPQPLLLLQQLKKEGKVRAIGISTPEHDQNCVIDLMRNGLIDSVQLIYNIFEQEPAAEILPVARETGTVVIVRVAFDEGVLTGKYHRKTTFADDDFRSRYFSGDRIVRAVDRVDKIKEVVEPTGRSMPEVALRFVLDHPAVTSVIPGIRSVEQAEANTAVSDAEPLGESLHQELRNHFWNRGFWYGGK